MIALEWSKNLRKLFIALTLCVITSDYGVCQ